MKPTLSLTPIVKNGFRSVLKNLGNLISNLRLLKKTYVNLLRKDRYKFSAKKHMRFRRSIKAYGKRTKLKPIDEQTVDEYLANHCKKLKPNKSASEEAISRLHNGWTLQETFGLKPLSPTPKLNNLNSLKKRNILYEFIFGKEMRQREVKGHATVDFKSLLTEFLTDYMYIRNLPVKSRQ